MSRKEYAPIDNLTAFKKAVDSPAGCDPMPVQQHEFPMKHPKLISRAVTEFMSVIYSKTIRRGHRQPVAVFEGGKKLFTLRDVAEDRKWSEDWTQRVFRQACACGLVRAGRGRDDYPPAAIVLQGRVNPIELQEDTDTNELVGPEGTLRARLSSAEFQQYEKLQKDVRERFLEEQLREFKLDDRIEADAIRLARHYNEQRHIERLTRYGITPDAHPTKRYLETPVVELKVVPEELAAVATSMPVEVRSVRSEDVGSNADTHTGASAPVYTPPDSAVSLCGFPEVFPPEVKLECPRADEPRLDAGSPSVGRSPVEPENIQGAKAPTVPSPTIQHARQDELTPELRAILAAIPPGIFEIVGDVPGPALLRSIQKKLEGAPPDRLTPRIRRRKWTADDTLGVLERIALDIGRAWKLGQEWRAAADADQSAQQHEAERNMRDEISAATRILTNPDSSDEDVKYADFVFKTFGIRAPVRVFKTPTAGGD